MKNPFEGCILVDLVIRTWSARKVDHKAGWEAAKAMEASGKVGRYDKALIISPLHDEVNRKAGRIRTYVYKETLPWGSSGIRIMPTSRFMDFSVEVNGRIADFEAAVDKLVAEMPHEINRSRARLGKMFSIMDYPSESVLRSKYAAIVSYQPVPSAGDFRVDMPASMMQEMKERLDERLEDARKAAKEDLVSRLKGALFHVCEKLSDNEAVFRDSLIRNIGKALEIGDDVDWLGFDMSSVVPIMREISSVSPDIIRNNMAVRGSVVSKASVALKNLEAIYG